MGSEQLIISTFNQSFKKYLYNELVLGKLAHTEFRSGINKGDEIDILMPGSVTLHDYDGGDLPEAEEAETTLVKIRIDRGKAVHFELKKAKQQQIDNAPNLKQKVALAKDYSMDGVKKFSACVDKSYGKLYTRAGHYVSDGSGAIAITPQLTKEIFSYMQAEFLRGDDENHTNWVDGQMLAIIPPEMAMYVGLIDDLKYVESGHKQMEKGYIGNHYGWDVLVSNNVATPEQGIYYPMFGIRGKTLAGGVSKELNMTHYVPEKNFNIRYKGFSVYGVGAPRADYLGTAKISAPLVLPSLKKTA